MACVSWVYIVLLVQLATTTAGQRSSEDARSNESCSGNFYLLEQSVLQSTENRFRLLRAFYPLTEANPVLVKVEYSFEGLDNHTLTWFWTESHYYLIQPLEIFQCTSLLFSNLPYRQGNISLLLDADCLAAPPLYFQLLTARVSSCRPCMYHLVPVHSTTRHACTSICGRASRQNSLALAKCLVCSYTPELGLAMQNETAQ